MTRSALQHLVRSCYRWAGVYDRVERGTLVHALRHTFATRLGENGASAIEIMELLGHGNLATSQGYIQASTREVRAAAASNPTYRTVRDIARQR
jgi:integrase/recombinase XerC